MVEYCLTIENQEKRNQYAKSIIIAMSNVNPNGKDSPNYMKKLWEHLFLISDYKLNINSPYNKPVKEEKNKKPNSLKYSQNNIRMKTYGKFNQRMIEKISSMADSIEKQILTDKMAHELKKAHLQWNINSCDDEVILKHLEALSDGKLQVSKDFRFRTTKDMLSKKTQFSANNKNNVKKNNNVVKKKNNNIKKQQSANKNNSK